MPARSPRITVVIPCFGHSVELESLGDALAAQTLSDFEVIVIDDGSPEPARPEWIDKGDLAATLLRHELNRGPSAARNTGLAYASAPYVTFLDADDQVHPTWLAELSRLATPDKILVGCSATVVRESGEETVVHPYDRGPAFSHVRMSFLPGTYAVLTSFMKELGGFDPNIRHGEHTELALRMCAHPALQTWRVAVTDLALVTKSHDRSPEKRRSYDSAKNHSSKYSLRKHRNLLARDPKLLADYEAIAGVTSIRLGDFRDGRSHLIRAARAYPRSMKNWLRVALAFAPGLGRWYWGRS